MVNSYLIPEFLKSLDGDLQTGWIEIYREVYRDYGEHLAKIAANRWLVSNLESRSQEVPNLEVGSLDEVEKPKEESNIVDDSTEEMEPVSLPVESDNKVVTISFTIDTKSGEFIKHDDNGEDYIDLVIADDGPLKSGVRYAESLLKKWADQINSGKIKFIGTDDDHQIYDIITSSYSDPETIKSKISELKEQNSIAKGIKAVVDKGRLWLKMIIDKRYKKQLQNKKVSIEAFVNKGDVKTDGDLLGLSFLTHRNPDNNRAGVVA